MPPGARIQLLTEFGLEDIWALLLVGRQLSKATMAYGLEFPHQARCTDASLKSQFYFLGAPPLS